MADTAIETLREEIKEFLKGADLSLASWKKVRAHLNDKFSCDFSTRKDEINEVVMEVLTELEGDDKKDSDDDDDDDDNNDQDDDSDDDYSDQSEKPKKRRLPARKPVTKKKRAKASDSDDESEEISEEENSEEDRKKKKRRATNGSAKGRKSANAGGRGGGGGGGAPVKAKATGYLKKLKLSPELSEVMGEEFMARNEVVKKMYAVVKQRDLLDPKNRQFAILDEQLQNVFGQKRVRMFGMLKLLGKHFSSAD